MLRLLLLAACAALPVAAAAEIIARNRTCDGHWRHYACHWSGGDAATQRDVPPDEQLAYGAPTLSSSENGRLHIVIGQCEITCDVPPPASVDVAPQPRNRRHGR